MNKNEYIKKSLETHLFFSRIMKEHSFFLEIAFTEKNEDYKKEAKDFKHLFEKVLHNAIQLSEGNISKSILKSGQFVTEYTLPAEQKSIYYTGTDLNEQLTIKELDLKGTNHLNTIDEEFIYIQKFNNMVLPLIKDLIHFKTRLLNDVNDCKIFTFNYPMLISHLIREAVIYHDTLVKYDQGIFSESDNLTEELWNTIMMEHAFFIRGLLDPSEKNLIKTADEFADAYEKLLMEAKNTNQPQIMKNKNIQETLKFRDFKLAGTTGILNCKIKSTILPLLADHVLREANHYLDLLEEEHQQYN